MSSVFAITFSDLSTTQWAYPNIARLVEAGVINGYTDGTYKPEKAVTRGEFFKLIMTAFYGGNEYFEKNNVNIGHWASPYAVEAAVQGYLMNGTTVTNLNDSITRLEMVHILAKLCNSNQLYRKTALERIAFSDVGQLDETSQLYIDFVVQNGLINGYTDITFKPNKFMTRSEVATVMCRFLDLKA